MSQFSSFRGSPNLQCPVTASSSLTGPSGSPVPGAILGSASTSSSLGNSSGSTNHPLSVRMAVTSAVVRPPGSPASSASPAQSHGGPPPPSSVGPPGGRCCDTGRPIFTDPITGQTVCSCQYELLGGYPRLGALPTAALSMYSAPYAAAAAAAASEGMAAYFPALGAEQAPFYTPTAAGLELKENLGAGAAAWPYPSVYHPYDAAFAGYSFNGYGMDLNGARRKNATRETTSTLKAWLNEHKKNPYPTKGEKIMLAIITKMTLTQVSTWFANARRRLKKENKMTWEPKNKTDDDDDAVLSDSEDIKDKDDMQGDNRGDRLPEDSRRGLDDNEPIRHVKAEHMQHDKELDDEDELDLEEDPRRASQDHHPYQHPHSMHHHHHHHHHHHPGYAPDDHLKDEDLKVDCSGSGVPIPPTKPKIWSLADTAACKTPPPPHHPYHMHHHHQQHHQQQYVTQQQPNPQHQQQQQQHHHHISAQSMHHSQQSWLGSTGGDPAGASVNLNSFALPSGASMSPSSAATAPYSSGSARYGGFLSSSSGAQIQTYNPNNASGNSNANATSSAAAGFPEVGTDTPPQTPPNMKVATPNGVIQGPPTAYCPGGNLTTPNSENQALQYTANQQTGYTMTNGTGHNAAANYSPKLHNSPHKDFSQNTVLHQHQSTAGLLPSETTTAFKPFYKGPQTLNSGFVSPV